MKRVFFICLVLIINLSINAQQSAQIDELFRNSYTVFELQRLPNGMYRDSKLLTGTDYHPISIANTGMGLIALCIADSMGWINDAEELALTTIKTAIGHTPGFIPDRTSNGYYRHFMDVNTGDQAWSSEYSTIDTDILISGALFCMTYFKNEAITEYVLELWNSINFDAAIANASTGQIYLTMNADGNGNSNTLTSPYNEYMIVAWLAKNYSNNPSSLGNTLWNNYYKSSNSLPTISYNGHSVLSDNGTSLLSSFTHQFNYYLCHYFTTSNDYLTYFENSQQADASWWTTIGNNSYEWGLGAGSAISSSYHADAINNNKDVIVSPHIIAGYIPINPNGKNDLIDLWNSGSGKYELPNQNNDPILWRYSKSNTSWIPNEIIGVDHATMLFGLSTLNEYLGDNFFSNNNDFFPLPIELSLADFNFQNSINVYPNPATDEITIQLDRKYEKISISITNVIGQTVYHNNFNTSLDKINLPLTMESGIFFLTISHSNLSKTIKIIHLTK